MADSKPPQKVFDISKPGKSAPSSSAKPILITNRPVLKDPMMVTDTDSSSDDKDIKPKSITVSSRIKIEPLHDKIEVKTSAAKKVPKDDVSDKPKPVDDDEKPSPAAEDAMAANAAESAEAPVETAPALNIDTAAEPETPPAEAAAPEPDVTASDETSKPEAEPTADEPAAEPDDEPASMETEAADDDADDRAAPTNRDELKDAKTDDGENATELAAKREAERQAELQKLALSHKYYLPINQIGRRRDKRMALVGVVIVLLLGLAWADVALDAGLLTIPGVKPLTHFFSK